MFFDGAFGTYYIEKTNDDTPCEQANLTHPDTVISIHKEYIAAGVDAIKTNTFATLQEDVICAGYTLAKKAAEGTDVKVFAAIGPKASGEACLRVVDLFITLGATYFLFETLSDLEAVLPSVSEIKRRVPHAMILVSFAVSRDGVAQNDQSIASLIAEAVRNPCIDAVGLNCICGPLHMLEIVRRLGRVEKPLAAMPNSGYSSIVHGRTVYRNNTAYFADKMLEMHQAGVGILGGCCGTTPAHIACAIRRVRAGAIVTPHVAATLPPAVSARNKRRRKPISVELHPPVDGDIAFVMQAAERLKQSGVERITFVDSPMSKTRADSFMTAALIKREVGIDVLPHLTCRDKNFIAIKGALLGASYSGINQVLVVTGDPVVNAENYRNPGVYNFNSKELIRYINGLNTQLFAGNAFSIGGAINVNAVNFEAELARCREKIENGVQFLYSQPIFSDAAIRNFKQARSVLSCKLFAGILPIVSYKNALFLNNELAGIDIPQAVVEALTDKTQAQAQAISTEFLQDVIDQIYDEADGFYIMTPMKKVELVCQLIQKSFS